MKISVKSRDQSYFFVSSVFVRAGMPPKEKAGALLSWIFSAVLSDEKLNDGKGGSCTDGAPNAVLGLGRVFDDANGDIGLVVFDGKLLLKEKAAFGFGSGIDEVNENFGTLVWGSGVAELFGVAFEGDADENENVEVGALLGWELLELKEKAELVVDVGAVLKLNEATGLGGGIDDVNESAGLALLAGVSVFELNVLAGSGSAIDGIDSGCIVDWLLPNEKPDDSGVLDEVGVDELNEKDGVEVEKLNPDPDLAFFVLASTVGFVSEVVTGANEKVGFKSFEKLKPVKEEGLGVSSIHRPNLVNDFFFGGGTCLFGTPDGGISVTKWARLRPFALR